MGGQQRTPPGRMVLLTISVALLSIFASPGSCQEIPAESGSEMALTTVLWPQILMYIALTKQRNQDLTTAPWPQILMYIALTKQRNQDQDMALTTVQWPQITVVCYNLWS